MASKTREQKFIHEFTAPYKFRSDKTGEIEIGSRRIGIRPHTQCNKFPHLILVCEYVKDCLGWGWKKSYYFDKKQNALFSTYNMRYVKPCSETSCFILHYLQDYFAPQAATADDDSQPELPETAEIITSASDNDNAPASQPASVATPHSDTTDDAKSLLDADYFKGKSIDEIKQAFSAASLKQLKGFALCYTIPYFNRMNKSKLIDAIASKISLILEERKGYMTAENVTGDNGYAQQNDIIIPATKPRTIPEPVRVKFIPGTVYAGNDSGNHFPVKITARNADFVTTDFIGAYIKDAKIQTIAGVEHAVFPMQYRNIEIWADKPELPEPVQSKTNAQHELPATADDAISANNNDTALASQPAAVANAESETKAQHEIVKFVVGKTYACIHSVCGMDWTGYKKNNYLCKYTIIARKGKFVTVRDELGDTAKRLLKTDNNGVEFIHPSGYYASFKNLVLFANAPTVEPEIPATTESSQPDNLYDDGSFSDAPGDNSCPDMDIPECHTPDSITPDNTGFTVVHSEHITRPDYTVYPDAIHDDIPCVNVPACVTQTLSSDAVNPLFSLNFFFAHCLFLFRLFCASLHSNLIPYMLRDSFTEFYPSHVKDFYADKNHFPAPFLLPCPRCGSLEKPVFAHRFYFDNVTNNLVEMLIVNCPHCGYTENSTIFSAKQDHSYSCYWGNDTKAAITLAENWNSCGLRKRHKRLEAIHICPPRSKYFNHARKLNKMKLDACSDFQSLFSLILTLRAEEILSQATYMRFKLTSSDNAEALARELAHAIIQRREKSTPVHAEINDITPQPKTQPKTHKPESTPDIEHKLIETKDLHFQERRKALDHNAAVISSSMFHEAIVSMLLKISPAAIFQLGMHMGLFIAKPKGKKIVIAEAFAKRLIEHRELHAKKAASVHTSNTHQTSKNTAGVPDNVKFFETKHGQFAFIFTDELVFTD